MHRAASGDGGGVARISRITSVYALLGLLLLTGPLSAEDSPPCANLSPQQGELGYQPRGDRCEGMFVRDTRTSVRLKSVLTASAAGLTSKENTLRAALLPDVPEAQYHLRVSSLDPRTHYQLDAIIPESGVFSWPMADVVGRASVDPAKLVPLGWAATEEVVYVPMSLSAAQPPDRTHGSRAVWIIIESTVPIQEFVARLREEPGGGRIELQSPASLPTTQLELAVPPDAPSGHYKLWLRVRLVGESKPEGQSWMLWLPSR